MGLESGRVGWREWGRKVRELGGGGGRKGWRVGEWGRKVRELGGGGGWVESGRIGWKGERIEWGEEETGWRWGRMGTERGDFGVGG
jgi:hypothetical protein